MAGLGMCSFSMHPRMTLAGQGMAIWGVEFGFRRIVEGRHITLAMRAHRAAVDH